MSPGAPQSGDRAAALLGDILPWLGMLALLAVAGWLAIAFVRRRLQGDAEDAAPFTLDDLRRLRREGRLSDAEFARARDAMIAAAKRSMSREGEEGGGADRGGVGRSAGGRGGRKPGGGSRGA